MTETLAPVHLAYGGKPYLSIFTYKKHCQEMRILLLVTESYAEEC